MRNKHYSTEQIMAALKQAEMGMPVADLVRELKQLADKNARLKKACRGAQSGQGGPAGRAVKKVPRPSLMKQAVDYLTRVYG